MTVAEILKNQKKNGFSFELLPPIKGSSLNGIFNTIDTLKEFNPLYINITTHHSEVSYISDESGNYRKRFIRKRPGTVAIAAAIKNKYGINVIPHIVCEGFTKSETEYVLIDLNFLDIHDLLVLRGDNNKETLVDKNECHKHATDLIDQINDMNNGKFLDGTICEPLENKFTFGVAGYPEKHEEAPNMDMDIYYLKKKVDAGAQYVVTQLFYDNQKYYDYVEKCRAAGINVPIVPGLKPITSVNQLSILPRTFKTEIPTDLVKAVLECKTQDAVKQVGVEWLTMQTKDLLANNVGTVHFYTLNALKSVRSVVENVF